LSLAINVLRRLFYILNAIRYVNAKNEEDEKMHNGARVDIYSFDELEVE